MQPRKKSPKNPSVQGWFEQDVTSDVPNTAALVNSDLISEEPDYKQTYIKNIISVKRKVPIVKRPISVASATQVHSNADTHSQKGGPVISIQDYQEYKSPKKDKIPVAIKNVKSTLPI